MLRQVKTYIRYSIYQIFRWQTGIKSRNPFRDAVFIFAFLCMMLSFAIYVAIDSVLGIGFIKPAIIVIGITFFVYDYFLNKAIQKIGMQGLTDEFLQEKFLMSRKEKIIFELITLFCLFSPIISMVLFVPKK